ncbi:MAG: amino acid adenylation domain-containing protein [Pseudodesulfovibrio sp.]
MNCLALIHRQIVEQARTRPDHTAIDEGERSITYGEFVGKAGQLASIIRQAGCARNARIAIFIENSIEAYIAILGTLCADCCYVPLGTMLPSARLADIIQDAGSEVVVTVRSQLPALLEVVQHVRGSRQVIVLDGPDEAEDVDSGRLNAAFTRVIGQREVDAASPLPPGGNVGEDLAYIIFTSGTTGRPKGVAISHLSLRDFVNWAVEHLRLGPKDRVSNHPSIHFDLSIIDIFGCLAAGATLCPVTRSGDRFLPGRFISTMGITVWVSVPSVLATMKKGRQLKPGSYGKLRMSVFCGEAFAPELARGLQETNPAMEIYNLYGPTEATCACTHYLVDVKRLDQTKSVPIGVPNINTELFVFKEDRDEYAEPGEIGRLMIGGSQLAYGYWGQPDLTAGAFKANPFKREIGGRMYETGDLAFVDAQGVFQYVGRLDHQVKVHGYRIELSEIELAVSGHDDVVDAGACVVRERDAEIVVAIVAAQGVEEDRLLGDIRARCERMLPHYMVPKRYCFCDSLPQNANGKKDRKGIAELLSSLVSRG